MTQSLTGTTVGGYAILDEIGQGGMATVYRAHQLSMNRDVAIKILPRDLLHQGSSLDRFKQEASIVARLAHRAIVPVHDYGEHEGVPYLVMRYMDSGSVDELLAHGPIPPEQTLAILQQIAPALDYAHREGVLHRDLKPSNILLDSNGDAYITDFGIARILGNTPKQLTTSGVVGTPSYMSPEQAQGKALDSRSDLYALGVVVFEMLTGMRPFDGETPYSVAVKHVTEPPPSPCTFNPALPPSFEPVLFKALEKSRERRYATAREMADALEKALAAAEDGAVATEPSLQHVLQQAPPRREPPQPAPASHAAPPPSNANGSVAQAPSRFQMIPIYQPARPSSYSGPMAPVRRRKRAGRFSDRLTWVTLLLLLFGGAVAVGLMVTYYLMGSNGGTPANVTGSPDYAATAIDKMTATHAARDVEAADPPTANQGFETFNATAGLATPTPLLTNTPRASSADIGP